MLPSPSSLLPPCFSLLFAASSPILALYFPLLAPPPTTFHLSPSSHSSTRSPVNPAPLTPQYSIRNGDAFHQRDFHEYENGLTASMPRPGVVDPAVESQYAYGSRAGVWRVYKAFTDRGMLLTLVSGGRGAWDER